jgi:hypothetical protein
MEDIIIFGRELLFLLSHQPLFDTGHSTQGPNSFHGLFHDGSVDSMLPLYKELLSRTHPYILCDNIALGYSSCLFHSCGEPIFFFFF